MSDIEREPGPYRDPPADDGTGAQDRPRPLSPAAQRALAEAEERRRRLTQNEPSRTGEVGGRDGPEPTRFGDWEKAGIASDF
ncbi:MAG: DUF1674 domain-containing protein [Hyphomicrobiaceae bacterium]